MKVYGFIDTHASKKSMDLILKRAKNAELLVCGGDLTIFGENFESLIRKLKVLKKKLLIVHGNHESNEEVDGIAKKFDFAINLHKKSYNLGDYVFFGYGGMGFSERDRDFEKTVTKFKKTIKKNQKIIFVFHAPPYGTILDELPMGHVGSKSIRDAIKDIKPLAVICGHLHENNYKLSKLGKTVICNPGPSGRLITL